MHKRDMKFGSERICKVLRECVCVLLALKDNRDERYSILFQLALGLYHTQH